MSLQGNLNLNICEAHAFNTMDRFTLDVFVVNGWSGEVSIHSQLGLLHHVSSVPQRSMHGSGCQSLSAGQVLQGQTRLQACVVQQHSQNFDGPIPRLAEAGTRSSNALGLGRWASRQEAIRNLGSVLRQAQCLLQGCEDLEEVLSERLQQLPAPLETAASAGSQQEPPVIIPDDLPAERERVRTWAELKLPCCRVTRPSIAALVPTETVILVSHHGLGPVQTFCYS